MEKPINDNFVTDQELDLLFAEKEAGKSFPEAMGRMRTMPMDKDETHALKELWELHTELTKSAHNISPDPRLFERMLEGIPNIPTVTAASGVGYIKEDDNPSGKIINVKSNLFMQMNWKIAAPIAVVVIAVVAVMNMGGGQSGTQLAMNTESAVPFEAPVAADAQLMAEGAPAGQAMMAMKAMPASTPVSGNVDDLAASLSVDADADAAALGDGSADAALVTSDSQSITDLTSAYDETTF